MLRLLALVFLASPAQAVPIDGKGAVLIDPNFLANVDMNLPANRTAFRLDEGTVLHADGTPMSIDLLESSSCCTSGSTWESGCVAWPCNWYRSCPSGFGHGHCIGSNCWFTQRMKCYCTNLCSPPPRPPPPSPPPPPPPSPPPSPPQAPLFHSTCQLWCAGTCCGFTNPSAECSGCDSRVACHPGAICYR
ncbi:hypothetical protein AB1Y20_022967 [Prymnesium parvum]|uniref:Uncharacterized protein n=1 Tax=Prymnesium parvum TaxID=97485 RepID=A0AB34JF16_PRYPA